MKKLFVVVCLLCMSLVACANKIDSLANDADAGNFLISVLEKTYPQLKKSSHQCKVNSWEKVDFNNDGHSDLSICVQMDRSTYIDRFIIIDQGKDDFKLINLRKNGERDANTCSEIIRINNRSAIIFKTVEFSLPEKNSRLRPKARPITDTLIYEEGGLVEFNPHPIHNEIESVIFRAGPWSDPIYYVKVNSKGKIRFEKNKTITPAFVKDPWGKAPKRQKSQTYLVAKTKLSPNETKQLFAFIDYIDFKNLKNQYDVPWNEHGFERISVKYKDGSVKEIEDVDDGSTFGLRILYNKFYTLATANKVPNNDIYITTKTNKSKLK